MPSRFRNTETRGVAGMLAAPHDDTAFATGQLHPGTWRVNAQRFDQGSTSFIDGFGLVVVAGLHGRGDRHRGAPHARGNARAEDVGAR